MAVASTEHLEACSLFPPRFIVSQSVLGPPQSESCVLPGAVVAALDPAMVRAVRTGHTRMLVQYSIVNSQALPR